MTSQNPRDLLLALYRAALLHVEGRRAVAQWLKACPLAGQHWHVVAIGKAAASMAMAARDELGDRLAQALVITKTGHGDAFVEADRRFSLLYAEHPIPGQGSLDAGHALLDFISSTPAETGFLFLLSGGASSLVEVPVSGVDLECLNRVNGWLLGSGLPIDQVNRVRQRLSLIKGGGLRQYLGRHESIALVISDVPGDDTAAIGSGLLSVPLSGLPSDIPDWVKERLRLVPPADSGLPEIPHHIVASSRQAINAAIQAAQAVGLPVEVVHDNLHGDATEFGRHLAEKLCASSPGVYVWGGETTVRLPDNPGRGGRNQHLALSAAMVLSGRDDCWLLSAGTDGTDGVTLDAGALVDGSTLSRGRAQGLDPEAALLAADAGCFLEASGDLVHTGPTGTNVMDLVIALRR